MTRSSTRPRSHGRRWPWLVATGATAAAIAVGGLWVSNGRSAPAVVEFGRPAPSDAFNGEEALRYATRICDFGPRPSGSAGMDAQREAVKEYFQSLGATVETQTFPIRQASDQGKEITGGNLIVRWPPAKERRVLLGAHYDTRPTADQEPVFRLRGQPFLGANDGASGVALLMELGKRIPNLDLKVGVDFVLFDAEEYIFDNRRDRYFLGSRHFVKRYQADAGYRYDAVVIVDMIGDRDLTLHPDQRSATRAGALVKEVWGIASELGVTSFNPEPLHDLLDDHVPFQDAGIPAIDIIDFDYPHWHRLTDTPDKLSAASFADVAKVLEAWLQRRR